MNLISDVKHELSRLELSKRILRQFGVGGGILILCLVAWVFFIGWGMMYVILGTLFGLSGITVGFMKPEALKKFYRLWMLIALILGWCVSRVILAAIFFLVITPIGLIAKLSGKKHIIGHRTQGSYWLKRASDHLIDYTKMY